MSFEHPPASGQEHASPEVQRAKLAFEKLAKRLDTLWSKPRLTREEQREVDIILNNAMIVDEMLSGKTPEEFREAS